MTRPPPPRQPPPSLGFQRNRPDSRTMMRGAPPPPYARGQHRDYPRHGDRRPRDSNRGAGGRGPGYNDYRRGPGPGPMTGPGPGPRGQPPRWRGERARHDAPHSQRPDPHRYPDDRPRGDMPPQHPPPTLGHKRAPDRADKMEDGEVRDEWRGKGERKPGSMSHRAVKRARVDGDGGGRDLGSRGHYERSGRDDYRPPRDRYARGANQSYANERGRAPYPSANSGLHNVRGSGRDEHAPSTSRDSQAQESFMDTNKSYGDSGRSRDRDLRYDRSVDHSRGQRADSSRGHIAPPSQRPPKLERPPSSRSKNSTSTSSDTKASSASSASTDSSTKVRSSSSRSASHSSSTVEAPRIKTPFGYRCELASLTLKANLAAMRSDLLSSRIECLESMSFEVNDGIVSNKGVKNEEPVLSDEVKAAIAAAENPASS